jgi:hypothetical protein
LDVVLRAADGVILRAWSIRLGQSNGDAILLLHGLGDNRVGVLGLADLLLHHG